MRTVRRRSTNSRHLWLMVLLLASISGTTTAQTAPAQEADLERVLVPGNTVWLTDATGLEKRARIVSVADGMVTTENTDNARDSLRLADIMRVRIRKADSVLNGALIGAGSAVASGLFVCTRAEPWANCRDDVGSIVAIGGLGAAVGAAVDALLRDRHTIFEASAGGRQLDAAPLITRDKLGVKIALRF